MKAGLASRFLLYSSCSRLCFSTGEVVYPFIPALGTVASPFGATLSKSTASGVCASLAILSPFIIACVSAIALKFICPVGNSVAFPSLIAGVFFRGFRAFFGRVVFDASIVVVCAESVTPPSTPAAFPRLLPSPSSSSGSLKMEPSLCESSTTTGPSSSSPSSSARLRRLIRERRVRPAAMLDKECVAVALYFVLLITKVDAASRQRVGAEEDSSRMG